MPLKITTGYHSTANRIAKTWNADCHEVTRADENEEQLDLLYMLMGYKMVQTLWKLFWQSYKVKYTLIKWPINFTAEYLL